MLAKIATLFY